MTGVQTCALPIYSISSQTAPPEKEPDEKTPSKRRRKAWEEIEFESYHQLPQHTYTDETDTKRMKVERQHIRNALGAARDWVSKQPGWIMDGPMYEHDFDWTAPELIAADELREAELEGEDD